MTPNLKAIDHVHVFVADRPASQAWYARVLGLRPAPELLSWASDGGPLTLTSEQGTVHLALFERAPEKCRSTVAMSTSATGFVAWRQHLQRELGREAALEDHGISWSLYFSDPDGNPYEITTYEYPAAKALISSEGA